MQTCKCGFKAKFMIHALSVPSEELNRMTVQASFTVSKGTKCEG